MALRGERERVDWICRTQQRPLPCC